MKLTEYNISEELRNETIKFLDSFKKTGINFCTWTASEKLFPEKSMGIDVFHGNGSKIIFHKNKIVHGRICSGDRAGSFLEKWVDMLVEKGIVLYDND